MGVILLNSDYKIAFVDHVVCEMLGYEQNELFQEQFMKLIPAHNYDQVELTITQLFVGQSQEFEFIQPLSRKDGSSLLLDLKASLASPRMSDPYCLMAVSKPAELLTSNGFTLHSALALAEAMQDSAAVLTSTLNIEEVLDRILIHVARVVQYDTASFMLVEGDTARIVRSRGWLERGALKPVMEIRFSVQNTHSLRTMYEEGRPFSIPDTRFYEGWRTDIPEIQWIRSYIGVPVRTADDFIGFLNLDNAQPGAFSDRQAQRLQAFADQAAIAIKNARLYEAIQQHARTLEQRVQERTSELQDEKERVETILNSTTDAICFAYPDGAIERINFAFGEMFGLAVDEASGHLYQFVDPAHHTTLLTALKAVLDTGNDQQVELLARHKDSRSFSAELALSGVQDTQGKIIWIVGSFHDITQRILTEESLRQALQRERELQELKTSIVSITSHEFRTPLTGIILSTSMLQKYRLQLTDEEIERKLDEILSQAYLLNQLVEDMLSISRYESGHLVFNPESVNLAEYCEGLIDELARNLQAEDRISVGFDGDCGQAEIDTKLIRQALANLLSNAVKYSPDSSPVRVTVRCAKDYIIEVEDQGIGIPDEDKHKLFQAFHRGSNVASISGAGLGLVVTKQAIDLHGGTISFQSEIDKGTTFFVELPRQKAKTEQ